ncbi:S1 family peptidase [Conexibacter woesei]|uniref:Peptidase S1 and S6 chymotrypsin/Hap n=1 Tax=Conexibacter woesei (strain DSM 14684 / CCUG 47730 / CIP 108061 / JCM 11494 / NBRC 100937 / ID131577) TaxID=469383 RepID=D3FBT0_CONWI|nr:serine protease [Conexibacter woesei]ADB51345.1 peptidase S1 and S6 chymotrypsin/Hap [Conexibacter woesei DSM 14684]
MARAVPLPLLLLIAAATALPASGAQAAGGPRAQASIVGGGDAAPGSWPSTAFVSATAGDGRSVVCTGTVVAPGAVLTAAHCVTDAGGAPRPAAAFLVVTGRRDLAAAGGQLHEVTRVHVHPAYDPRSVRADAAVVELASTSAAPPATLAGPGDAGLAASGTPAAIAGWGMTSGSGGVPTVLRTAPTTLLPDAACTSAFGGFDAATMLCAADAGSFISATCHGDSGGPLAVARGDGSWVQVGITSWGTDGCDPRLPQVFARVSALSDWVGSVVSGTPPADQPPVDAPAGGQTAPTAARDGAGSRRGAGRDSRGGRGTAARYRGTTRQRRPIALRVSPAGSVGGFDASYRLRCRGGWRSGRVRAPSLAVHASTRGTFDVARSAGRRTSFRITGAFSGAERVSGTVRVVWRARSGERCRSGPIRYVAWRA